MNPKVLLVDSEKSTRESVTKYFSKELIRIKACETTKQALQLLKKESFTVVIVDISFKELGGLEFVKNIQHNGLKIPVIAITDSKKFAHVQEAVRLNIFDYIIKPFEKQTIVQIIQNAHKQFLLNNEKDILQKQKDEYRDTLEIEVKEHIIRIKESEKKYRNLVEQSIVGVGIIQENKIVYTNTKFANIFGYIDPAAIIGLSFEKVILPQKYLLVKKAMDECIAGIKNNNSISFPALKNNTIVHIQAWLSTIEYNKELALQFVLIDNTEQELAREREKKYQFELLKENRMAAIGQLTTGIAHNLNTPISIIQGNAELLNLKYQNNPEIGMILKQTKRIAEAIRTISSKGNPELSDGMQKIDINEIITREIDFLESNLYFKHKIKCILNLDNSIPFIEGRYTEYSQGISAIVQNALDAMYKKENPRLIIQTNYENNSILVRIKDSGTGMNEQTVEHIFEPFFTTKPANDEKLEDEKTPRGTGLGLSIAYNLLKKNNIKITVLSSLGTGSEFILKIPANYENGYEN